MNEKSNKRRTPKPPPPRQALSHVPAQRSAQTHSPALATSNRGRTGSAPESNDGVGRQIAVGVVLGTILMLLLVLLLWWTFLARKNGSVAGGTGTSAGDGAGEGGTSGTGSSLAGEDSNPVSEQPSKNDESDQDQPVEAPGTGDHSQDEGTAETGERGNDPTSQKPRSQIPYTVMELPASSRGNAEDTGADGPQDGSGDGSGGGASGGGASDGGDFFGVQSKGHRFVYVIDCSTSMSGAMFDKACKELLASISDLRPKQRFFVMFFSTGTYPMFGAYGIEDDLVRATKPNARRLREWVTTFHVHGGTEPLDALLAAIRLKPDVIYLLTDGGFDPSVAHQVRQANKANVTINTIAFVNRVGEPLLKRVADENGGAYLFVP